MTDNEMLQLAGRASGLDIDFADRKGPYYVIRGTKYCWNAALNTKQAYDLADRLRLMIDITDDRVRVICGPLTQVVELAHTDQNPLVRQAVNRTAIVMIAAQIQRARESKAG